MRDLAKLQVSPLRPNSRNFGQNDSKKLFHHNLMLKSFQINPYREVIFACIVFGSTGVFVKYIDLPATSIAFFRLAIPTVLIGIWMRYTQKIFWQKGDVKTLLIISTLNALRMYLYFVGFTMTSVGNAVVSLYT